MPPMTLSSMPLMAGTDEGESSMRESSFRFDRGISGHKAHRAREEGVGLAMESL